MGPAGSGAAPLGFDVQEGLKWARHAADAEGVEGKLFWAGVLQRGASIKKQGQKQELMAPSSSPEEYMALARKAAESGDPGAEMEYAYDFVKEDAEKLVWFQKAADQGYTGAMNALAEVYLTEPSQKDPKQAVSWVRKSIANGDASALLHFADLSCQGTPAKNGPLAIATFKYALTAAEDEWTRNWANLGLAHIYAQGTCAPQDGAAATRHFLQYAKSDVDGARQVSVEAAELTGLLQFGNRTSGTNAKLGMALLRQFDDASTPLGSLASKDVKAQAQYFLGQAYEQGKAVPQNATQAAAFYMKAADGGNVQAMSRLGILYETGSGVSKDPAKAAELYLKASDQGFSWGTYNLATLYQSGSGVAKDEKHAFELYMKAANSELPDAMNRIGLLYEMGAGTEKNQVKADEWYRKAAEKGFAYGALNLANSYYDGKEGNNKDVKQAFEWYTKAAEMGLPDAMNSVGFLYERGESVQQDPGKAAEWFRKAAEKGFGWGAYNLGDCYAKANGVPQDWTQAAHWYQVAANQGIAPAYLELGKLYRDGKGVEQNLATAQTWFEKSAAQGNAEAELNLGNMYSAGVTGSADMAKAADYYKKAADAGNVQAEFAYGYLLEHGQGVQQDEAAAARYYDAAGNQNHAAALNNLGMMFAQGRGVPRDSERALQLFQAGAKQGDESASKNAEQMAAIVEQERQVREAQAAVQRAQEAAAQEQQEAQQRQDRIAQLQDDIQRLNQEAADWDAKAQEVSNSGGCTGLAAAICSGIGQFGAAKARQNAANARSQAQNDVEEIQRLSGMEVHHVRVDTSYAAALQQQVNEHPVPTIEDTLAQQQANLYATAAANQHQKLAQQQAALAAKASQLHLQQVSSAQPSAALPSTNTSAPITVTFTHTMNWSQGNAHVVSTPPGINCPPTCSASFQGVNVTLKAQADSGSIIHNVNCYAQTGGGTAPLKPGNSMACVWPGLVVGKGGTATVIVDAARSNQQAMITGNGLPPNNGSGGNGGNAGGNGGGQGSGSSFGGEQPNSSSCTSFNNYISYTVKVISGGEVVGSLTNNSNQTLYVNFTFARGRQAVERAGSRRRRDTAAGTDDWRSTDYRLECGYQSAANLLVCRASVRH